MILTGLIRSRLEESSSPSCSYLDSNQVSLNEFSRGSTRARVVFTGKTAMSLNQNDWPRRIALLLTMLQVGLNRELWIWWRPSTASKSPAPSAAWRRETTASTSTNLAIFWPTAALPQAATSILTRCHYRFTVLSDYLFKSPTTHSFSVGLKLSSLIFLLVPLFN